MRKSAVGLSVGAVVLLGAAVAARFVALPAVDRVPSNHDSTSKYAGTISMLNPAALTSGDLSKAFLTNVPVNVTQHVKTTKTSGSTAVMTNDFTVVAADGTTLLTTNHTYAVDRVTLEAKPAPAGSQVDAATGLAISFPLKPEKKSYQYWDSTTDTAAPAAYTKTESHDGRNTYVYTVTNSGPVKDAQSLKVLPQTLPKSLLAGVASALPAQLQQLLNSVLAQLPDTLNLSYTSKTDTTLWVDSATGTVIDVNQHQVVTANLVLPTGATPMTSVLDLTTHSTDTAANAKTAKDNANALLLVGTYGPIGLAVIAVILLLLIPLVGRRKRADEVASETAPAANDGDTVAVPAQPTGEAAETETVSSETGSSDDAES